MKQRKFFILSLFFLTFMHCLSQTSQTFLDKQDWRIIPGYSGGMGADDAEIMKQSTGDFNLSRVALSSVEIASLVVYKKKDYGVILINNVLNVKWSTHIEGVPLTIAKFHNKLLVITTPKVKVLKGVESQLSGVLIDPLTGNIIATKLLFSYRNDVFTQLLFIRNEKANDLKIGVRTTLEKKQIKISLYGIGLEKMIRTAEENYEKTDSFQIISLTENLSEAKTINFPVQKDMRIIQCVSNEKGELYVAYFDGEKNISIQKYDADESNLLGTNNVVFEPKDKSEFTSDLFLSNTDNSVAYLCIDFTNSDKDYNLLVYRLDFSSSGNTSPSASVIIDKNYRKASEASYIAPDKEATKLDTKKWDNMKVVNVVDTKDEVVIFKEVYYEEIVGNMMSYSQQHPEYYTGDAIVSIYDKDMKLISEQIIPKEMEFNFEMGISSSLHIQDGRKLSIVSVTNKKKNWGNVLYSEIDLSTNKLTKYNLLERSSTDRQELPDPRSVIWFDDGFEINFLSGKGLGVTDIDTYPEKFKL